MEELSSSALVAGRDVPRIYSVSGRADLQDCLTSAVVSSGGRVLYASSHRRAPMFLGVEDAAGRRQGLMIYPFRVTRQQIRNRPSDEVRGQLRYGSERSWHLDDHWLARDVAGVDTTLLLGVYLDGPVIIGLDPALYDPLPLGISAAYMKDRQVEAVRRDGWHVWERENHAGARRAAPPAARGGGPRGAGGPGPPAGGIETLVAFAPDRLLDYAALEHGASALALDPPLRHAAAVDAASLSSPESGLQTSLHSLEASFDLSASEILDIIHTRMRLEVAVKGGVAEHHLQRRLQDQADLQSIERLDEDGRPDFDVTTVDGRRLLIECKNASAGRYANGDFKVEIQKTRATRDDPAGRLYRHDQFDVVAACLYSATRRWEFRYRRSALLARHERHPDRLAALHRVDQSWHDTLQGALAESGHA